MMMEPEGRPSTLPVGVGELVLWVIGCSFVISVVGPVGTTQPEG